jgi:hypothetical protein
MVGGSFRVDAVASKLAAELEPVTNGEHQGVGVVVPQMVVYALGELGLDQVVSKLFGFGPSLRPLNLMALLPGVGGRGLRLGARAVLFAGLFDGKRFPPSQSTCGPPDTLGRERLLGLTTVSRSGSTG